MGKLVRVLLRPLISQEPSNSYLEGIGAVRWITLKQPLGQVVWVRFGQKAKPTLPRNGLPTLKINGTFVNDALVTFN